MKAFVLLLPLPFLLVSCGYVSKSTVHSKQEWKAYKSKPSTPLPDIQLKVGERKLAYQNKMGFPPMFGGYTPSLLAADESVVRAEISHHARGSNVYLIGLKPGTTTVHQVNGLVDVESNRKRLEQSTLKYEVTVLP